MRVTGQARRPPAAHRFSAESTFSLRKCRACVTLDTAIIENETRGPSPHTENSIVFGGEKENAVTLDELAKIANTINYELLCILSKRVPRIYVRKNQLVDQLNYICPDKNDNE